jgi:hypothetical protein
MYEEHMFVAVRCILASGDLDAFPARRLWPLHLAVRELIDCARPVGVLMAVCRAEQRPCPSNMVAVAGVDAAVTRLDHLGFIHPAGTGRNASYVLDQLEVAEARRWMMRRPALETSLYRRAGIRWSTLAVTLSKNLRAVA